MIRHKGNRESKREELERKITDAAEGRLDAAEIRMLEEELKPLPGLRQDYLDILGLPDLSRAYGQDPDSFRNETHIRHIQKLADKAWRQTASLEEITVTWFRKYALAAAILIFTLTSLSYLFAPYLATGPGEMTISELFYPFEESNAEEYIIHLEELIDQ